MERWLDVGPLLEAARADLKASLFPHVPKNICIGLQMQGQLVSAAKLSQIMTHFHAIIYCSRNSLFEAMSALEAGNPKMDAAASPSVERPTLEALLADPNLAPWDLPESTLLDVLDQLLAMEASWHCGGSAMQTVYACLYMLKLDRVPQQQLQQSPSARALYAYCRTLQYDCALVRDLVMSGAVCEEVATAKPYFEEVRTLVPRIRETSSILTTTATTTTTTATTSLPASSSPSSSSYPAVAAVAAAAAAAATSSSSSSPLSSVAAAASPGAASSGGSGGGTMPSSPSLAPGFLIDVNRHLLGPSPPRQVKVMSVSEALSYMERMAEHLLVAVTVSELVHDYLSLQLFLWRYARMRPGAVARSAMHSLVMAERWQPAAAAAAATIPAWVPTKEMIAAACRVPYKAGLPEDAVMFFDQAVIAVTNVLQAMLMNRCRSRRRLRRCLDDWYNMYHHGLNADVVPAFQEHLRASGWRWRPLEGPMGAPEDEQGPLSTWVEIQTSLTMLHHLMLGFELELYEPLEYDMIYWWVYDKLGGVRINNGSLPGANRTPPPFNTAEQRFEQRFAAFMSLPKPVPLTHNDYLASTDPGNRDAAFLLGLASASFKEARLRCSALAAFAPTPDVATGWVRGLERVAATNAVVAGVLRVKLAPDGTTTTTTSTTSVKWDCDWSLHPYFPAMTLPKPAPAAPAAAVPAAAAAPSPGPTAPTSAPAVAAVAAVGATAGEIPEQCATCSVCMYVRINAAAYVSSYKALGYHSSFCSSRLRPSRTHPSHALAVLVLEQRPPPRRGGK
ncbi:hypothetical protein VOLCADRAFT_105007 [Volvox carteri f. nagariensis]|uniref:Uncharacterized protein n=1 Tax=Volvox carteri f. nagariensis TaxID=3068 RepID=D8TXS3_VOLCA|nr:uncharacterized protein VOLCADRAFT_105007 [Volvox carteri f. nagariensis]EFJ47691.1 hypothetical protein VOLCADRAFT_105007 [Volvox carteri f. nagariensis]|eukprot:XP_002951162.1 hypothetical protein VOLCADRAFT_105007 [Volvox carteri f. nagariensis]